MRKRVLTILVLLFSQICNAQEFANIFDRLQGISNNGVNFYNIDGIEITSQKIDAIFNKKNISKKYKQLKVKENEIIESDSSLNFQNFIVKKSNPNSTNDSLFASYYFIESQDKKIVAITFMCYSKMIKPFEIYFVQKIYNEEIPNSIFHNTLAKDSINFAGRQISIGPKCHWMNINSMQCSYQGQMDWSIHENSEDAKNRIAISKRNIKNNKNGKFISDTIINVIFEGSETIAQKVVYDFSGIKSALLSTSGAKTLTIYFVAGPVRNNFVSCVMSHWNNDIIEDNGLPFLLSQVMKIK